MRRTASLAGDGRWHATLRPEGRLLAWSVARLSTASGWQFCPNPPNGRLHWRRIAQSAAWHRLLPVLHYLHKRDPAFPPIPSIVLQQLEEASRWTLMNHLLLRGHLLEILNSFRESGLPVIVLKGIPLEENLYPQVGLRPTTDIDLMVRLPDLSLADQVLESVGFAVNADAAVSDLYRQHHHHSAPYVHKRTDAMVELHWDVVSPDRPYGVNLNQFWANAEETSIDDVPCLVLAPEDQLLHLSLHFWGDRLGQRSGALLQLCDIALLLKRQGSGLRWDYFTQNADSYPLNRVIYTVLYVANLAAGASYPEGVAKKLRPASFDDRKAHLFLARRVIGIPEEGFRSLVKALGASDLRGKAVVLSRGLSPLGSSMPGANQNKVASIDMRRVLSIKGCWRLLTILAKLVFHLRLLWHQVLVERWLVRDLGGPVRPR